MKKDSKPLHPDVRIGHVHLKVADPDRALSFYRDVLGFELTQRYGRPTKQEHDKAHAS